MTKKKLKNISAEQKYFLRQGWVIILPMDNNETLYLFSSLFSLFSLYISLISFFFIYTRKMLNILYASLYNIYFIYK
jgi:hypothetical protein